MATNRIRFHSYWQNYSAILNCYIGKIITKFEIVQLVKLSIDFLDWQLNNCSIHCILPSTPVSDLLVCLTFFFSREIHPKLFVPKNQSKSEFHLYYKRVCPSKNELHQQGISFLEREGERERRVGGRAGGRVSRQVYLRLR